MALADSLRNSLSDGGIELGPLKGTVIYLEFNLLTSVFIPLGFSVFSFLIQ